MKQIFLISILVLLVVMTNAQKPTKISKDGMLVGQSTVIDTSEFKTLNGIETSKTISEQFGAKPDTSDVWSRVKSDARYVNEADTFPLTNVFYTKAAADSADENRVFNWVKQYMFPKILALPMTSYSVFGVQQAMIDGRLYITFYKMNKDTTITSLNTFMAVQGSYTEDNYNGMVLYTTNGTGITEVARTTNDGNIWKTAIGSKISKPLGSSIAVTKNQIIGIGCLYNSSAQTNAPTLPATGGVSNTMSALTDLVLASVVVNTTNPAASYTWGQLGGNGQLVGIWPE